MARVLIDHVTKRYGSKGEVLAVDDLSLECPDKELLAIIGPSGCGKSSTLRMIAGLEEITRGEIYIGDTRVSKTKPRDLNVAMVFENYALYPHLNVYDNMALNLKVRKMPKTEISRKISQVASILEIEDILHMSIHQLSSGQKQRVSLGRAIVRNPHLFCIDEPLSHVDVRVRINVRAELKRLFKDIQATAVYVTHNQEDAIALADKIAVMNVGELQQVGTATDLYDEPKNTFVAGFVGQPTINLIEGRLRSERSGLYFTFDGTHIEITDARSKLLLEKGKDQVTLGVRPLHFSAIDIDNSRGRADVVTGELVAVQYHGNYSLVSVERDGVVFRAQLPGYFHHKVGEPTGLRINMDKVHFFDRATGAALL